MAARKTPSKGAKPEKLMRDALIVALHREAKAADGQPTKKLALVADQLITKALQGDVSAIKEVFDRVDGKSVQPLAGDPDNPIAVTGIQWQVVAAQAPSR